MWILESIFSSKIMLCPINHLAVTTSFIVHMLSYNKRRHSYTSARRRALSVTNAIVDKQCRVVECACAGVETPQPSRSSVTVHYIFKLCSFMKLQRICNCLVCNYFDVTAWYVTIMM